MDDLSLQLLVFFIFCGGNYSRINFNMSLNIYYVSFLFLFKIVQVYYVGEGICYKFDVLSLNFGIYIWEKRTDYCKVFWIFKFIYNEKNF